MASFSRNVVNQDNSSDSASDNIVDRSCEPCMKNSLTNKATLFCLTNKATLICKVCNVLLCDQCRHPHTIHIVGKHEIVRIKGMDSVPVVVDMIGMNTCQSHGKKIKYYCNDHSKLCCTTCAISHGKCDQLDEIASVSERKVPDPSFLKQILLQSEADADSLIVDCEQSKADFNQSIVDISTELHEMRDRVMKLFGMAEKSIMSEANAIKCV
ncbi:uncharacterized protein LOC127857354 [Dreissena polymorpha]|uniref:B box-type domain-containing protein n=1 Tax=Dreissena polymorpha TaxID=45954 RepID=A0A9D3Z5S8_DREPO|nr:uncharacterized protein LOC127857354 [Dreissena polymorpha]KAH3711281.1 hypothetical protein DPMN_070785 [Dreissena polymorpha]